MSEKLEISINKLSHYESLKKQDLGNRRLIKKLQIEIKALKQGQTLPIDNVIVSDLDIALAAGGEDVDLLRREGFIQGAKWMRDNSL